MSEWAPSSDQVDPAAVLGEKSAVEIEEADDNALGNWMYSGPGRVGPSGPLKVWRQNRATGACEEKVIDPQTYEHGTYHKVAMEALQGGGTRLPSKDFPHAPTVEQERLLAEPDLPFGAVAPGTGGAETDEARRQKEERDRQERERQAQNPSQQQEPRPAA